MRTQRSQRRGPSRRVRIILVVVAVALLIALISLRGLARFYTDYLWFKSLGFGGVFTGLLGARVVPAVVFTAVFFVVLLVNLIIADRLAPTFIPSGPEEEFVQRYREVVAPYTGRIRVGVALVFALIAGGGVSARWHDWILFRNRVDFGVVDKQFHTDIGFYVFQLPFLKFLFEWTFAAFIIVFLVTAVAHYLNGGIRVRSPFEKVTPAVKAHLSVLLGVIALVRAAGYYLQRYELDFSTRGAVHGASYTDVHAQLPALNMLIVISLVGAVLFVVNIWRRGWVLPVLGVGLWAFVSLVIGQIYPAVIQRVRVEPNELAKEAPYIQRNIDATRSAFKLDAVDVHSFPYKEDLNATVLGQNRATIDNARLWDPAFLPDTLRQLQRIRNFYQFNDVDIDRYVIDGKVTQTVLSARELDLGELPSSTWVNKHLVFTHGYGVVMAPANAVGQDGEPVFTVKDIPPVGNPELTQPRLYYGEDIGGYSIVDSREREFDYPEAQGSGAATTHYSGSGGVPIGGTVRRTAFWLRFGDFKFLTSSRFTDNSRVIFARDVRARVEKAAPFLRFDADPYPVVVGGKVLYVIDGYTSTDKFPYSQAIVPDRVSGASGLNTRLNYVRNSVKATVDAYTGKVTFYVIDHQDPLIRAYEKAFPELFTDGSKMSDELRAHLRYPEDLFRIQSDLFSTYHMTKPEDFYNRSDQWAISTDPGSGRISLADLQNTNNATQATRTTATAGGRALSETSSGAARMDPYYLLMKLPDASQEEFVLLQPFSPPARQELGNLLAFMAAKSDPGEYGKLAVYVMPRGEQVFGPTQVDSQIKTTASISEQLTLLNREGSSVIQGNLQLVPVGNSILYVRPLYVEAQGATNFPHFQFVIVFYGGDAVMDTTLQGALAQLFEGVQAPSQPTGPSAPTTPGVSPDFQQLLQQAQQAYQDAQTALKQGDLGAYQKAVQKLGDLIAQMQGSGPSGSSATTSSSSSSTPSSTTTTVATGQALGPARR